MASSMWQLKNKLLTHEKTPVTTDKYLTVVYKETSLIDGFILTAYFSKVLTLKEEEYGNFKYYRKEG